MDFENESEINWLEDTMDIQKRILIKLYQPSNPNSSDKSTREYLQQYIVVDNYTRIQELFYLSPTKFFSITNYNAAENDYQLPFWDDEKQDQVQWNIFEPEAPVLAFMDYYKIDSLEGKIQHSGGIGADTGSYYSLLKELLPYFVTAAASGIIGNLATDALKNLWNMLPCVENLQRQNASVESIRKYLNTKEEWSEEYLLRKLGFDTTSNLEYFMASFGFELKEHVYHKSN